jgi:hypothetical protein
MSNGTNSINKSSKINKLNPVPVYGYHQFEDLQCNTPMNAAYCRMKTSNKMQSTYNKLHYPVDPNNNSHKEGFSNKNIPGLLDMPIKISSYINDIISYLINNIKLLFNTDAETMTTICSSIINSKNNEHQLPQFKKSKVSPLDNNSNNILVNQLFLRQCFDSQYDNDVISGKSRENTLIQK